MKNYLCIVGVLCALALVKCELPAEIKKMFEECAKEVGLPAETFKGLPNFEDSKVKCFHACMMEKSESMADGKIVAEKVIEWNAKNFPEENTDSFKADINECISESNGEKDKCDVAGIFHKCILEKYPHPKK